MEIRNSRLAGLLGYIIYGILTCAIIIFVWSAIEQVIEGTPWLGKAIETISNSDVPYVLSGVVVLLIALITLTVVGFVSKKLIWSRLAEVPVFAGLAGSVDQVGKQLLSGTPERQNRVVWVHWPSQELQTIGVLTGSATGVDETSEWFTVVILPTAGKVTGGSLRRIRREHVTPTSWSVKEALAFVSSSGAAGSRLIDHTSEKV